MKKKSILSFLIGFTMIFASIVSVNAQTAKEFTKTKIDTTDYVYFRLTNGATSKTSPYGWTISKDSLKTWLQTFTAAAPITHLYVTSGANKSSGSATLTAGTVTISNTLVTANSQILITRSVEGGTLGHLRQGTIVAGTSFVVASSSNTDTSTFKWTIIN